MKLSDINEERMRAIKILRAAHIVLERHGLSQHYADMKERLLDEEEALTLKMIFKYEDYEEIDALFGMAARCSLVSEVEEEKGLPAGNGGW